MTIFIKDDPCTNAGRGSNLTEDGRVECDASIMDGHSGAFGAVGAVPGILNPEHYIYFIELTNGIMHHQQFLWFIWFCLQIAGCISFRIHLSHEFSECHLWKWGQSFKLCMSVPYVVDQAFKMRSRLLLYWPRSKWRDLLCWVEYLPCNDYLALLFLYPIGRLQRAPSHEYHSFIPVFLMQKIRYFVYICGRIIMQPGP